MRLMKVDLTRALAVPLNFAVGPKTLTTKASLDKTTSSRPITKFKVAVADKDGLITSKVNKSTSLRAMCQTQAIVNSDDKMSLDLLWKRNKDGSLLSIRF